MLSLIKLLLFIFSTITILMAAWKAIGDANRQGIKNLLLHFYTAAFEATGPMVTELSAVLKPLVDVVKAAFDTYGGPIATELRGPIAAFVKEEFDVATAGLVSNGESTPDNAVGIASDAMADAFGFGAASAAVTAAFEALFPEKLNTLNGVGPMLAKFAGFDEVAAAVRDPLYHNAFGRSLDYHFRAHLQTRAAERRGRGGVALAPDF